MFYSETVSSFSFEKGKINISSASLLYCHGPFVLSAKKGFSV